jgi:hypothetical protein
MHASAIGFPDGTPPPAIFRQILGREGATAPTLEQASAGERYVRLRKASGAQRKSSNTVFLLAEYSVSLIYGWQAFGA